jgi:adenine-specific DNA-methyltransferase
LKEDKGQFWTPEWIAQAMADYVLAGGSDHAFDPAVGRGALLAAAKTIAERLGKKIALLGTEIDPQVLEHARSYGLGHDLTDVEITDSVLNPPKGPFQAIVANPPYVRHHRLPADVKASARAYAASLIGEPLDGRVGLHVYFLLRALDLLDVDGRLAFILPADTCEGIFAPRLRRWVTNNYLLESEGAVLVSYAT